MTDPDESARRLYDALRTAGMTPVAWGEWEQLAATSPAAQARLRHAARLLWPEPPAVEPVVGESESGRRLYEAVQQIEHYGLTWKDLADEDKAEWSRVAGLLWPEPEQGVAPVEEAQETDGADDQEALLYEALRQKRVREWPILPWSSLHVSQRAYWRDVFAALWLVPERPAGEPAMTDHRHMWDCAACRHDVVVLYCRWCPAIRKETL